VNVLSPALRKSLDDLPVNLKLDVTQLALDLFGIFDPTPITDGVNGFISLCRGDFFGAAISVISIVPGADVLKALKLEKYVSSVQSMVRLAKNDIVLRMGLVDLVKTLKELVDKLPTNSVSTQLKRELDAFLKLPIAPKSFSFPSIKHLGPEAVQKMLKQNGFKLANASDGYRIASRRVTKRGDVLGSSVGPKEIWSRYDSATDGYLVVRMDPQGHATKVDFGPSNISVVSQRRSGEHLAHGGRPHYHKEWVPAAEYNDYLRRPTNSVVKYDDAGDISLSIKGTHIPR